MLTHFSQESFPTICVSAQSSALATSILQLIANGKSKTALDHAKEFHKKRGNAESESLLIDAYLARIRALFDQNLTVEAKSLDAIVRQRFPAASERLDTVISAARAKGGDLDALLKPLTDPALSAERRAEIEQIIQNQVTDLASLANCEALPAGHSLRQAAAAIDKAFGAVTSAPVTDEQIALREVSHRSPLASWKLLIRAIACFYRDQDQACEEYLAAIKPESAVWQLVPALRAMLRATPGATPPSTLKPAQAALASRTTHNLAGLRRALADLDHAFANAREPGQIFKTVRATLRECRQIAPDLLAEFRRKVYVRGEVVGLDSERMTAALEGAPRTDAIFFRDLAHEFERAAADEDFMRACECWDLFRHEAMREGWFAADSLELAALYLHMAGLLGRMSPALLRKMQRPSGREVSKESNYFRFPEELYARACLIDQHPDCFSQWLAWARKNSMAQAGNVALAWSKALPDSIDPLLFLMAEAEHRNSFVLALSYLNRAERIDAVNSTVRAARFRLLAVAALQHLGKKKPKLAAQRLAELGVLPQSRQGDRPAFLSALRFLTCMASGDEPGAGPALLEVERLLGDGLAAVIFIHGCAASAKRKDLISLPPTERLPENQRSQLPASMARAVALAADVGLTRSFQLPVQYFDETEARFPRMGASLNVDQIRVLGELGITTQHPRLAWAASAAGLDRGGPTEAYFLFLRARALPESLNGRYQVLMAAAAEVGRSHRDAEVVSQAVEAGRGPFDDEPLCLTAEQASEVLRKEKASPAFPSRSKPGPDYSELLGDELCMCPDCRRERGQASSPDPDGVSDPDAGELDREEMKRVFFEKAPKDIPPELLPTLFEAAHEAFLTGADPAEILAQILPQESSLDPPRRQKRKKVGRK